MKELVRTPDKIDWRNVVATHKQQEAGENASSGVLLSAALASEFALEILCLL